jgi:hypothetical protein
MRDELRERLATEVTRKQFLQYVFGALLMMLGFANLLSMLRGTKVVERHILLPGQHANSANGFGSRKFGV